MDRYVKTNLTKIGKQNKYFSKLMGKLALDKSLTVYEASYILTCAMLFIKEYEKDVSKSSYVDIAYYIILKYFTKIKCGCFYASSSSSGSSNLKYSVFLLKVSVNLAPAATRASALASP